MTRPLEGRTAIITGGNQGLGLAIARAYVQAGASVMLCARGAEQLDRARAELLPLAGEKQSVWTEVADVSKPADVTRVVEATLAHSPRLHILVNNAGVYGPKGTIESVAWEEWVRAMEINLFGSVLMARAVLPHFKSHGYGKIVQISGGGATQPMPRLSLYAASKAAVVRFAETLAGEVKEDGIDVNAIAPGALNTRFLDELLEAGPEKVGQEFYERSLRQKADGGSSPERGAALAVFLASAASDGMTGKLISAIWDPWEGLAAHRDELQTSDIYTLRRIVPKDRGMRWGERE
jgi:NAD(P)-dependent dehydrogenase (short-subunit alcohol dehydrogenase family)